MGSWKKYSWSDLLENEPACYVIYIDGVLSYVGSTKKIQSRIDSHFPVPPGYSTTVYQTQWGPISTNRVRIKYRPSKKFGDWLMVELRLINRLQPRLNVRDRGGTTRAR